ncbi:hypothetical protein BLX42_03110 [Pseudomonas sp. SG-MS2]|uniref:hypothetical protein n=1 Tax=Pseudomonas sp. SG-MS2 TaxID=1914534 RepID=UPI001379C6C0|nr:hypothetical protein [Pseudomonas sp. SG-MS2]KAF1312503.1 hypothetical protein BLX42_03110 [Pseudomonas sp. SG-MS2]
MFLKRIADWLLPVKRSQREKEQERDFIQAVNRLETLSTTERGGMSIDAEELRDAIMASYYKRRRQDEAPNKVANATSKHTDTIQYISWRRLENGSSVQYTCLQSITTGEYAVACESLFSGGESLPTRPDIDASKQVAASLTSANLQWHKSIKDAMDAWDRDL